MSKPPEGVYAVLVRAVDGRDAPVVTLLKLDKEHSYFALEILTEDEARALGDVLHKATAREAVPA